jgi:hypothetical protein
MRIRCLPFRHRYVEFEELREHDARLFICQRCRKTTWRIVRR